MEDSSGKTYYFHIPVDPGGLSGGDWLKAGIAGKQLYSLYKTFKGFSAQPTEELDNLDWEDFDFPG